ncbi:MAG: hypothetical protein JW913_02880 [Chitinispirillaceae bacterium]|nr:hypothetical protein [Chitinispirillaceae bacterium]
MKRISFQLLPHHRFFGGALLATVCLSSIKADSPTGTTFISSGRTYSAIIADQTHVWAGTCGQGLLRINKSGGETCLYTSSNSGLPDNCIRDLELDKQGALLVGTAQGGVVRFDGTAWSALPEGAGRDVRDLAVDSSGVIWAYGQSTGVVRFNGTAWAPVINSFNGKLATSFPSSGSVWMYDRRAPSGECSRGMIYEYVRGGLQSTISLESLCPETSTPFFFIADEKHRWIGAPEEVVRINGTTFTRYPVNSDTSTRKNLTTLAVSFNNVLLAATTDYVNGCEIYLWDQINHFEGHPFDSMAISFPDRYIRVACIDYEENFWLGASDGSIIRIDRNGNASALPLSGTMTLPGNTISSLLVDRDDTLWAGVGNGIVRFDGEHWTTYPAAGDTLGGTTPCALAQDSSGTIWAGFQQPLHLSSIQCGLAYRSGPHWKRLANSSASSVTFLNVKAIAADRTGDLWAVCTEHGYRIHELFIERVLETRGSSEKYTALDNEVNTIAFDTANTAWIGTGLGLKRFSSGIWVNDSALLRYLPSPETGGPREGVRVTSLYIDADNTFWIGTAGGVIRLNGNNGSLFDTSGGVLPANEVTCIAPDESGGAWIGTKNGLVHLSGTSHTQFTTSNSALLDNEITAVAARAGDVWIGTQAGGLTLLTNPGISSVDRSIHRAAPARQPVVSAAQQPNRSIRFTVNGLPADGAELSILTLQGRLIRKLQASSPCSPSVYVWDGTDLYHRRVPGGMFLAVLKGSGRMLSSLKILRR